MKSRPAPARSTGAGLDCNGLLAESDDELRDALGQTEGLACSAGDVALLEGLERRLCACIPLPRLHGFSNQRPSDAQPNGSRDEALKRGKYDTFAVAFCAPVVRQSAPDSSGQ